MGCEGCPYQGSVVVPYEGKASSKILFLGEAPGREEIAAKPPRPFIGESGKLLDKLLSTIPLVRDEIGICNSLKCFIQDKKKLKEVSLAMKSCRCYLEEAMQKTKQKKLIVLLGAYALKQVLKLQKPMSHRGKFLWSEELQCWCFVTVHPAYVLRGRTRGFPNIPIEQMSMKEKIIFKDFDMIRLFIESGYQPPTIETSGYRKGNVKDVQRIMKKAQQVALDFESTSANMHDPSTEILSISLSYQEGESFIYMGKDIAKTYPVLTNPKIQKIVASRPFEEHVCKLKLGIELAGTIHDILPLAHLQDENYFEYNLESVANSYTDLKNVKDLAEGQRGNLKALPPEKLIAYNGVDTDAPLRAFNVLREKFRQPDNAKLRRYYVKFMLPVLDMFAEISLFGCKVDTEILKANEQLALDMMGDLSQKVFDTLPAGVREDHADKFKLTRKAIIRDALFSSRYGMQLDPIEGYVTEKTFQPQISKEHLQYFRHLDFVDAYLQWAALEKIYSSYLVNVWQSIQKDGKIYPTTHLTRARTGRTVMLNPPIQTFPKRGPFARLIRDALVAIKGWLFGSRDLSQNEIRFVGWLAGDKNILAAIEAGIDIHSRTAALISGVPLEKVDADLRDRAKAPNFGFIYGMQAHSFRLYAKDEYGVDFTEEECYTIRERFFSRPDGYYMLPVYHAGQKADVREKGYVESVFGRRRRLPNIYSDKPGERAEAERQAINFPVQSPASDLGLIGKFLFWQEIKSQRLQNHIHPMWYIHDNNLFQAKEKYMPKAMTLLKDCMECRAKEYVKKNFGVLLNYPVESDSKVGPAWGSMSKYAI